MLTFTGFYVSVPEERRPPLSSRYFRQSMDTVLQSQSYFERSILFHLDLFQFSMLCLSELISYKGDDS